METESIVILLKFAIREDRQIGTVTIGYRLGRVSKRWELLEHICMPRKDLVEGTYSMQTDVSAGAKSLNRWEKMVPGAYVEDLGFSSHVDKSSTEEEERMRRHLYWYFCFHWKNKDVICLLFSTSQ